MGVENFIPELWAPRFIIANRKSLVFASLCNRDYEGEIREFGDTVHINELGAVSVSSYTKGESLTYSDLDSAQKTLLIDQAVKFAFKIDDIDNAQSKPKLMDGAMADAAYRVADNIDAYIAGLYAGAGVQGGGNAYIGTPTTSLSVSSGNVIETISYMGRYLTESNCPNDSRWIVLPPWLHQKLLLAEVGGISATAVPKIEPMGVIPGFVGQALGFEIFVSNNVSVSSTQYRVMAGNRRAISFAGQLTRIEALRLQTYMADAARGLYLYGAKVVNSDNLVTAYLAEAAG